MALNDNPGAMASFENDPSQIPGYVQPRRLSIAALLSLISSLILCIPILTQVLGIFFGIFGIVIIVKNPDRRKGLALAISGVAISVLVLLAYFALALFLGKLIQYFPNSSNQFYADLQAGNTTNARLWLDATTEKTVTDGDLKALSDRLTNDYGQFQNAQFDWSFRGYQIINQPGMPKQFQDEVPAPLTLQFDKGTIHVLTLLKPNGNSANLNDIFLIERTYFIPPNGKVWQFPKATPPPQPANTQPANTQPGPPADQTPDTKNTPPQKEPDPGG